VDTVVLMYETMTTYMLPESPESSSHAPSNQVSNSASLIGSPRSTPVFGNGHILKSNGCASKDLSPLWNGNHSTSSIFQQQQQQQHVDDENQSVRSDNSMSLRTRKSSKNHGRNPSHRSHNRSVRTGQREFTSPSPLQTAAVMSGNAERSNNHQEVIEVQILPQDDGWGDNVTAITGNTSVASGSMDDVSRVGGPESCARMGDGAFDAHWPLNCGGQHQLGLAFQCQRYMGTVAAILLGLVALATPITMVLLPRLQIVPLRSEQLRCTAECEGLLISLTVKLVLLALGTWAVFWRPTRATMPRIFFLRTLVLLMVFITTFAYCLFYGVRVVEQQDQLDYKAIVTFALSLVDALLFVHYAAILLLEIRQMPPRYYLHVIRSPDGMSKGYAIGAISIQRAAVWLLDQYYTDFPIFNPFLERLPPRRTRSKLHHSSSFKFYDLDVQQNNAVQPTNGRSMLSTVNSRRNNSSHNERFYEEHEYERRLKKRKARLITAAEEAFTHIRRLEAEQGPAVPMDPYEAAQAIFPSMARPLQKYLRITRQQPRHTVESILQHLAICLSHDLSARAFVEKFLVASPVMQNDKEKLAIQTWSLVCDVLLSRGIEDGTVFQLRQNDVSLLCRISTLPHYNITEEIIEPKSNKFVLRLSSETSV